MATKGELNWVFSVGDLRGRESITVTNLGETPVHLSFDIYFEEIEPIKGLTFTIGAERVYCFRLDKPFCDQEYKIPKGRYSLVLHSDLPVVAVFEKETHTLQGYSY